MSDATIGQVLREGRERKGLTQGELAGILGVTQGLISRWENDQAFVAPRFHKTLAQVLHMDGSWLKEQLAGRTDVERALKLDERLNRKEKEALAASYRKLADLPPLPLYVSRASG